MAAEQEFARLGAIAGKAIQDLVGSKERPDVVSAVDTAYAALKNLENTGQLTFPEPQDTVVVGTIDPTAGTFTWAVPTLVQTTTLPPPPGQPTSQLSSVTVGVVSTNAVDLLLSFNVVPAQPVSATPASVSITGFPTVTSADDLIVIDAGFAVSTALIQQNPPPGSPVTGTSPPVSRFDLTISIPGQPAILAPVFILRPPVLGIGAFTIDALPVAIVYAPPQGASNQNTATYTQTESISRSLTTTISNGTSTKSTPAYTAADLIGNAAAAITAVAAVVGTGGAAAGAGAGIAGLLGTLTGQAQADNDSTADATQQVSSSLNLVKGILVGLDDTPVLTTTDSLTVESDNTMTLTHTDSTVYKTEPGKGPGIGDRIIYLYNLRAIWMNLNGAVGIHVLGADATVAEGADTLIAELQNLESGGQPTLPQPLSIDAIKCVLAADVMVDTPPAVIINPVVQNEVQPPRVGLPRFIPADPPEQSGSDAGGDQFTVTVDQTTENRQVTTTTQTTASDLKPGWVSVILGADNTDTTTTATFTTTQTVDVKADSVTSSTITMFGNYSIVLFTDALYGSYAALDTGSPLLQGVPTIFESQPGNAPPAAAEA